MDNINEQKYETLKSYFGYDAFREGQEALVDAILAGRDCLGVMPTGAGKSICYQLPALLLGGITLVVSPLISLMKDQVGALVQNGVRAAYLNSSLTEAQIRRVLDNARLGMYRIIYVAPERLETDSFREFAQYADISMVTVDEAHCISQWGQDFRPSYMAIRGFIDSLLQRPVISAFTATATQAVRSDILERLRLFEPRVLVSGFDRANIFFEVQRPRKKADALFDFLEGREGESGIVYCSTRQAVEDVCAMLKSTGISALCYHAGLPDDQRRDNQDAFQFDRARIMVATNAFGMGIDKSNVRFVVHHNMPKDIESYYQEAGRAGRDGEPAHALLLFSERDVVTANYLINNNRDAAYQDAQSEQLLKERERKRLRKMTFYCRTGECLRGYILKYFGETPEANCGSCSNCQGGATNEDITTTAQKILSCVKRTHERFGVKMVLDVLRGAKRGRIAELGFDKLSTYNICKESEQRLRDIVDNLIDQGVLSVTDGEYPILKFGDKAEAVLRGTKHVKAKLLKEDSTRVDGERVRDRSQREARRAQERERHAAKSPSPARPVDKALFQRLAELRRELAKAQDVPPYVVFHDSTLMDMCVRFPSNEDEFLLISGVGKVKLQRYGEAFLGAIAEYVSQ